MNCRFDACVIRLNGSPIVTYVVGHVMTTSRRMTMP